MASPYENYPLFRGSQSPRTQIRTILPVQNGGGEELFDTTKSKEQLYIEAKHVLNMVEPYESVPRKPPRTAKNDVLIGTQMIGKTKSPEQTLNRNIEALKIEYQSQLQLVSTLKKQLNDLELRETEEINQLELERSLLNAEFDSETGKISKTKMKIALLKHKELRLSGIYEEFQKEFEKKCQIALMKISNLEDELSLETDAKKVTTLKEKIEVEKKSFEDLEFTQMEEISLKESEREEILKEISGLEKQVENHEIQITEIDKQQKLLLKNVRQETEHLDLQRKSLSLNLTKEKEKMKFIEKKLTQLGKSNKNLVDPEFETEESEDESIYNSQQESNLEARLSRLALLDKTQREINQISVATESMLQQSPGTFYRISSRNLKLPKLDFDNLDSIGSEYESSSDIHTER